MKLRPRQKAFADYYIELGNATEAAKRAGYSKRTARVIGAENLTKPYIRSYIDERMASKESERIASQDEVLELLTRILRGEEYEEFPIGIGAGMQEMTVRPPNIKERLEAAEKLGRRHGIWKDTVDVTHKLPTFVNNVPEDDE
ncbi:terminase small subunit [Paenibacillus alvei]|uniref:terminase small subunit n=1 Tax=Paenibacillus alvei TaxID=44250 RepID=UPI002280CFF2|nr:terminase small subunit [Paenibacillus alvei]